MALKIASNLRNAEHHKGTTQINTNNSLLFFRFWAKARSFLVQEPLAKARGNLKNHSMVKAG